eukprot:TRINITY_DN5516_c0_g1_i4.p1 TRINITY_DN5516_c0_g1~~TRINITY_DN5516_c0_g1_i4.p1  ORF type:complete len:1202 (-),score=257.69 TRINITY_DN5516_c0_g1_i4:48-3653(-)
MANRSRRGARRSDLEQEALKHVPTSARTSICKPVPNQTAQRAGTGLPHLADNAEPLKGASNGVLSRGSKKDQPESSEERNKARRRLRLADPQARLAFLKQHFFFKDTSPLLRERLAPQLVRCSSSQNDGRASVLEQGAEPDSTRGMDYLFLTPPDVHTQVDVIFDGKAIAVLGGNAVFGQEVVFGVTTRFVFGTRISSGSLRTLWVVPKSVVQTLLSRAAHREDHRLLKQRAHNTIVQIFRGWYNMPTTHLPLRLFAATEHSFKRALVEEVEIQIVPAGAAICKELDAQDWAFCVWRGEAKVIQKNSTATLQRLSHGEGSSAWAAWWGLIELLEVSTHCSLSVYADTDCVLWRLTPDGLRVLKRLFPQECRLFQKVAMEHVRMLHSTATKIREMNHFKDCSAALLTELESADMHRQVVAPGTVIIEQGEANHKRELYLIARGNVSVKTPAAGLRKTDAGASKQVILNAGDFFGEAAAFQVRGVRSSTLVAETICDLLSIAGETICEIMARHPEDSSHIVDALEARGVGMQPVEDLRTIHFFRSFSTPFLERLLPLAEREGVLPGFDILRDGEPVEHLHVLIQGDVLIKRSSSAQRARQDIRMRAPALFAGLVFNRMNSSDCKCPYTVTSTQFCGVMKFRADEVIKLASDFPEEKELLADFESDEKTELRNARKSDLQRRSTMMQRHRDSMLHLQELEGDEEADELDEEEDRVTRELLEKSFQNAEEAFILAVQEVLLKKTFEDGEVILQQGADGDYAILLATGSGTVEANGTKVGEVQAGSVVGEAVLLGKATKRTATVRAVGQVTAYTLSEASMRLIFHDFPKEKERMISLAALRASTNKVLTGSGDEDKSQKGFAKLKKVVVVISNSDVVSKKAALPPRHMTRRTSSAVAESVLAASSNQGKGQGMSSAKLATADEDEEEDEEEQQEEDDEDDEEVDGREAAPSKSSSARKMLAMRRPSVAPGNLKNAFKTGVLGVLAGVKVKRMLKARTDTGDDKSDRPAAGTLASDASGFSDASSRVPSKEDNAQEVKQGVGQIDLLDAGKGSANDSVGRQLVVQGKHSAGEGAAEDSKRFQKFLTPLEIAAIFEGEGLVLHREFLGSSVTPQTWAKRRAQDMRYAQIRQEAHQVSAEGFTPLLPPGQSYISPASSRPGTVQSSKEHKLPKPGRESSAKHRSAARATQLLLSQAQSLYGKPVWHESK